MSGYQHKLNEKPAMSTTAVAQVGAEAATSMIIPRQIKSVVNFCETRSPTTCLYTRVAIQYRALGMAKHDAV